MEKFTLADAANLYGIDSWGASYFQINDEGRLEVCPRKDQDLRIDLLKVVEELKKSRMQAPILLRFPQVLETQVNTLCNAFEKAREEFHYEQKYFPVFPIKVNQQSTVVQNLLKAGYKHNLGLEVGSKAELMGALAFDLPEEALTICNGFKDEAYFEMASLGAKMGKRIITVIEKPFELKQLVDLKEKGRDLPWVGFRVKLRAKGSGLWEKSGGSTSKFGLSTSQLLDGVETLRKNGMLDRLKMFHFHIGSQITEIRRMKEAIKEAARIYAKVRKLGIAVEFVNVGGGLGIDYDGSKTSSDASVNYTIQEYANDVVYNIADVCENEHVPEPKVVTESGRAMVAYHSALIVDVRGHIECTADRKPTFLENEPRVIEDLLYIHRNLTVKNYREYYHDAVEARDQLYSLFSLGMLDLEERAKGEWLYWEIAQKAVKYSKSAKFVADEFVDLEHRLFEKFICNFSVFQSIPDHWALDQLFPVVPIHRLEEKPNRRATLVDITCDSDGEMDKFVDLKDIKYALEVHDPKEGEPYYLAFLLIGAYQDTMGDLHNLFGGVNEAQVLGEEGGKFLIQDARKGETIRHALELFGFEAAKLVRNIETQVQGRISKGLLKDDQAAQIVEAYKEAFNSYPYLS